MSDMSDFEQRYPVPDGSHFDAELNIYVPDEPMTNPWAEIHQQNRNWAVWQAAKQSMQGEAVAYIQHHKAGNNLVWDNPGGNYSELYTHAPDSAARIAELEAEIAGLQKKLEEARNNSNILLDVEALQGCLEWLKCQEQTVNVGPLEYGLGDVHIESSAGWLTRLVESMLQQAAIDASLNIKGGAE